MHAWIKSQDDLLVLRPVLTLLIINYYHRTLIIRFIVLIVQLRHVLGLGVTVCVVFAPKHIFLSLVIFCIQDSVTIIHYLIIRCGFGVAMVSEDAPFGGQVPQGRLIVIWYCNSLVVILRIRRFQNARLRRPFRKVYVTFSQTAMISIVHDDSRSKIINISRFNIIFGYFGYK